MREGKNESMGLLGLVYTKIPNIDRKCAALMTATLPPDLLAATDEALTRLMLTAPDPYEGLNAGRAWFNQHWGPTFEWYLEDEWNHQIPGQTWIEHHIRCLRTRHEFGPLGYDVYLNHQDSKGVWHLDAYQHSVVCIVNASKLLAYLSDQTGS
jgi:hypothetical protein